LATSRHRSIGGCWDEQVPSLKRGRKDRQPENASPRPYGLLASRALAKDGFQAA